MSFLPMADSSGPKLEPGTPSRVTGEILFPAKAPLSPGLKRLIFLVVSSAVLVLAGFSVQLLYRSQERPYLVKVNATPIHTADVLQRIRMAFGPDHDLDTLDHEVFSTYLTMCMDDVLLMDYARKQHLPEVDAEAEKLSERLLSKDAVMETPGGKKRFTASLKKSLMLLAAAQDIARKTPPVTEEELRKYYEAQPEKFQEPEKYVVRRILFHDESDAKKAADSIRWGKEFAEVAREKGMGEEAAEGGLLPPIPSSAIDSLDFAETLKSLHEGGVSPLIETFSGYMLLKLEQKIPAKTLPFEVVEDEIRQTLTEERQSQYVERWKVEARNRAKIEYGTEKFPWDVDQD